MWVDRFKEHLFERLAAAGHPDVGAVDWWDGPDPGQRNIRITCVDGAPTTSWC